MTPKVTIHDLRRPESYLDLEKTRAEIIAALSGSSKSLPSKLFYNERGSELFEKITEVPEYYLTRSEFSIFERDIEEMSTAIGPNPIVVEFGSGAGRKTGLLLNHLQNPIAYIPIEINREQLLDSALSLTEQFPAIEIWPVCADYTDHVELPRIDRHYESTLIFFPGSTIGNFAVPEAIEFLRRARAIAGSRGKLLIGADLKKDRQTIEAAYNDAEGVTAEFNLNILRHLGELFGTAIDLTKFGHLAFYNPEEGRIEMHIISNSAQTLALGEATIELAAGEHIVTEYSYKYDPDEFERMLLKAGWSVKRAWTDANRWFGVFYATA